MSSYEPLSPRAFMERRWRRFTDCRHAASWNRIPVTAPEAVQVGSELPLFFSATDHSAELIALTGLKDGQSDLLDANGQWRTRYQPALVRCAPFRLLPLDKSSSKKAVCVDLDSGWVDDYPSDQPDVPELERFFPAGQTQPSEAVAKTIDFLKELEGHRLRTQKAIDQLFEQDLLQPVAHEQLQALPGLLTIKEKRLNELDGETFLKLRASGALPLIYVQLLSAHQLPRLLAWSQQAARSNPADVDLDQVFGEASDDLFRF